MADRWKMLIVLFLARTAMGVQFQSVAALSPLVQDRYGIGLAEIGLLIGLYLAPGASVALPGGVLAARLGEKRIVVLALAAMLAGAVIAALAPSAGWLMAGRLVAGTGGVILNIVMTKLLVDWFAGREMATAMAIFVNSWPVGIAAGLLVYPVVAESFGLGAARMIELGVVAGGLALFALVFRVAPGAAAGPAAVRVVRLPWMPLVAAGLIWALYNAALAMLFSFGPTVLVARGLDLVSAGGLAGLFMVVAAVMIPPGGVLADRTGRRDMLIAVSVAGFAVLIPATLVVPVAGVTALYVGIAAVFALAAGPIMTLPGAILAPPQRAFGMGVFFTLYYAVMMVAPSLAGRVAETLGTPAVALLIGSGMSAACLVLLGLYRVSARRVAVA